MTALSTFDVLGFGAVAVDDLLYVEQYPTADAKVGVQFRLRQCGGLTGTALVAAARFGARCAYVGLLGNDELSAYVTAALSAEGIDMRYAVRADDARPAFSTIVVDRVGTRTIFCSLDGRIGADEHLPDAALIRAAKVLLVDHHGIEGTLRAVRIAREAGVPVVADFERRPEGAFDALLAEIDHLVISSRFAAELTGKERPEEAASALWTPRRNAVVVTCGVDGSWAVDRAGPVRHFPAFQVETADTTGCGDVFHGVYAAALAENRSVDQAIWLASAAAAMKAARHGGQQGIPKREELEAFLGSRGPLGA